jgi:hypothetical protein
VEHTGVCGVTFQKERYLGEEKVKFPFAFNGVPEITLNKKASNNNEIEVMNITERGFVLKIKPMNDIRFQYWRGEYTATLK